MINGKRYFESTFTNWNYEASLSAEENVGITLRILNLVQTHDESMEKRKGWEVIFDQADILMRNISDQPHVFPQP